MDIEEKEESKEKRGRKPLLNEEHKKFLEEKYGDDPQTTVYQALDGLCDQFEDLKVSQSTVYNFIVNECALLMKKTYFYPAFYINLQRTGAWLKKGERERNCPDT